MTQHTMNHPHPAAPSGKRFNFKAFVKSGAVVPAIAITIIGTAALSMVTYITVSAVANHGLMPRPTALDQYTCQGFAQPFTMTFRHGKDAVQLHAGAITLHGELINGEIQWSGPANAIHMLGFVPPVEMVYDDTKSIHLLDSQRVEQVCTR
jgi:hypothetical protein